MFDGRDTDPIRGFDAGIQRGDDNPIPERRNARPTGQVHAAKDNSMIRRGWLHNKARGLTQVKAGSVELHI
jgi:hypothetical protein